MDRFDFQCIERDARACRARELRDLAKSTLQMLGRLLERKADAPARGIRRTIDPYLDLSVAERFIGLANFQDRLKNSRPPRIAVIRSISRSKCSGTSTKFRRSLLTMSSGLSE